MTEPTQGQILLLQFVQELFCEHVFLGDSPDGDDLQKMGVKHGILKVIEYDPLVHGVMEDFDTEPGDSIIVFADDIRN